jgi:hypothetical protein
MRRFLESKIAGWLAFAVIVCVTAYLFFWHNVTSALVVYGVFLVMAILGEIMIKRISFLAPLVSYIILVVNYAVKFALEDEFLRQDEAESLEVVVKYGAIMLLTIPILYFNRSLKY